MIRLLVPITAATAEAAAADLDRACDAGADGVELRLDLMGDVTDEQVERLCARVPDDRIILLTLRGRAEGGAFDGDDADRVSRLIALGPLATHIDVEFSLWQRSANIRQKVMLALRRARHAAQSGGAEVIDHPGRRLLVLSRHAPQGRPPTLSHDLVQMFEEPAADIVKIAWMARTPRDNFEAFELMRQSPRPLIAICMGDDGLLSRVLAPKFGAFAGFAALAADLRSADGQLTLADLKGRFRWDRIGPQTAVYGLIGDPVAHSLSPTVHNAAFDAEGIDAVYAPIRVNPGYESFKAMLVELRARPWMDVRGLSVTAPHKEHALRWMLEQGGDIADATRRIGAVNTLRFEPDGRLSATNTDADAVIHLLAAAIARGRARLAGTRVDVLGAGGVARAAIAPLIATGAHVTVYARSPARAEPLQREFGCAVLDWSLAARGDGAVIINATPIGQAPAIAELPIAIERLHAGLIVLDTVYRPHPTRLIAEAERRGCICISGLDMFLAQAAEQYRYWHGRNPPADAMRKAAMSALSA